MVPTFLRGSVIVSNTLASVCKHSEMDGEQILGLLMSYCLFLIGKFQKVILGFILPLLPFEDPLDSLSFQSCKEVANVPEVSAYQRFRKGL